MGYACLYSRAESGLKAPLVTVEVHLSGGLPRFTVVGLAETAVRESRERVRSALMTCEFDFPQSRITVNLGPADLPKHGGRFDLAIALGILGASGQIPSNRFAEFESYAELTLGGQLSPVTGILPASVQTRDAKRESIVANDNRDEACLVTDATVWPAKDLISVVNHLRGVKRLPSMRGVPLVSQVGKPRCGEISDVRGQVQAKRALLIAAAGGHNLLLQGPPGTGKSMLAQRMPGLLPPLDAHEAMQCATIRSVLGRPVDPARWRERPFRAPHHTASAAALVGGGSRPLPGEVSRAHHGVLFLDELPEFSRHTLEVLREPIENGRIHLSRAAMQVTYPARFQLIAAMNPCPCGYRGDPERECRCSGDQVSRYAARVSGPLLDRIDLQVQVARLRFAQLASEAEGENSATLAKQVSAARELQLAREGVLNRDLGADALEQVLRGDPAAKALLHKAADQFFLSARACHRILRVARTIADLAGCEQVAKTHLAEALALRLGDGL